MSASTDPFWLASRNQSLRGTIALDDLVRLADALAADSQVTGIDWLAEFSGVQDDAGRGVWMTLQSACELQVACVRCLEPVAVAVDVNRRFELVTSDAVAAMLDADSAHDVLAVDGNWDLIGLLEDELLLALPLLPRHSDCDAAPVSVGSDSGSGGPGERLSGAGAEAAVDPDAAENERQFPFAGLADQLKKPRKP